MLNKYFLVSLIFLLTFGVYLYTAVPNLTSDDSGELAGVGATLGIAHSPGYPLYSLTGRAANALVPWGNPAYRINFLNGMFIAAAAAVLFLAVLSFTLNVFAALAASLIFAFSNCVWGMANVTEVYGLAAFVSALLCYLASCKPSAPLFMLAGYIFGIGLTAHYTVGLFIPGLLWWVYSSYKSSNELRQLKKLLPKTVLFGLIGFSAAAFILVRAQNDPVFGWEDPKTLERFWQVIARLRYGTASLAQGGPPPFSPQVIIEKLIFYFKVLGHNLTFAGLLLLAAGAYAFAKDKARGWTLMLFLLGSGPGFLLLANVGIDKSSSELLERFFFLSQTAAAVIIGAGIAMLPKRFIPVTLVIPAYLLAANFSALNHRGEFVFRDYAKNILRTTPPDAVLLSDRADEMEFCVAYLLYVEGRRPDISFSDCNAGITRSIYGDKYYRIWGKPRLEIRTRKENDIIAASRRPVYYATFEPDMIPIRRYQEGLIYRAKPENTSTADFPYSELYSLRTEGAAVDNRSSSLVLSHYYLLGKYYTALGRHALADKYYEGVSACDRNGKWTLNIGFQFHSAGNTDYALKYYLKAVRQDSADTNVYTNLGVIYKSRGEARKAHEMYEKALELDPNNIQAHYNLFALYWQERYWPGAESELAAVLKIDPNHAEARRYMSMLGQMQRK